nr:DUF748 domain-containing protein [Gammaproteobacteria bacterium]
MNEQSKDQGWRRVARKRWLWWLLGLALVFGLVLGSTPVGLGFGLKRALLVQGLEQVDLENVDFNPFTGRLTVYGLVASAGGRPVFRVPKGSLDLGWLPLVRKRVYIEQVTLEGAEIIVVELEDGRWLYGGMIPPWEEEVAVVEDTEALWQVGARELHVVDSRYVVEGRALRLDVAVAEARLQRASPWEPDEAGQLSFAGTVNGADLQLQAQAWPFARVPRIHGRVNLSDFPLAPMAPISQPALNAMQGQLDLDTEVEGEYTPESGLTMVQAGVVALTGFQARRKDMDLADTSLHWDGRVKIQVPVSGLPRVTAKGKLEQGTTTAALPANKTAVRHAGLSWQGTLDFVPGDSHEQILADGEFSVGGLDVTAASQSLKQERLEWAGTANVLLLKQGAGPEITAEGKLDGANLTVKLPDGSTFGQDKLGWQGKLHQASQKGVTGWQANGKLQAGGMRLQRSDMNLKKERISWDGLLSFQSRTNGNPALTVNGKLSGGKFLGVFPKQGLQTQHKKLSWAGRFSYGEASGSETSESEFSMGGFELSAPEQTLTLFSFEELQLEGIRLGAEGTGRVARTRLGQVTMLTPTSPPSGSASAKAEKTDSVAPPALFRASEAVAEGVELAPDRRIAMGVLQVKDGKVLFRRDRQGRWYVSERMRALTGKSDGSAATVEAAAPTETETADAAIRIDLIRLDGGQVRLEDEAVSPPFRTTLRITNANVTDINSADPEQRSQISLQGTLDKYTKVNLRTRVQPFGETVNLDGSAEVDGLEMPPLAPYTIQQVGYTFTSGELDANVELAIDQGAIDGEARLVFSQLDVEADPAQKPEAVKTSADPQATEMGKGSGGKLTMPITTALSLLRDKDNSIRLRVPISGDVSDPKFSVQDAVNKALARASRKSALTYVKFAIQPYGAIIAAVEVAGKAATVIRLDP